MTVGKPTYQLIKILEQYGGEGDKGKSCKELQEMIEKHLADVGYENLNQLTENGVMGLLFFMYGAGMINPEMIVDFMGQPNKEEADFFNVSVCPSAEDKKLYAIKINYLRRRGEF